MLGMKTLLRLAAASALITGALFTAVHIGQSWQADGDMAAASRQARQKTGDRAPAASTQPAAVPVALEEVAPKAAATAQPLATGEIAPAAESATSPVQPSAPVQASVQVAQPSPSAADPALAAAPPAPEQVAEAPPAEDVPAGKPLPPTGALSETDQSSAPASAPKKKVKVAAPKGATLCQTFKSYNAATQTYRGLDGKTHECKAVPLE